MIMHPIVSAFLNRIFLLFLFLLFPLSLSGQRNADFGLFGGTSSYIGDINETRLFYAPLPAGGLFYRYNFNPRQALRTNIFIGGIRGKDSDFSNNFQRGRDASFSGMVGEWALQYEFNFFPYSTQGKRWNYTPYLAAGAGISFINTSAKNPNSSVITYVPVIPFSIGFKINVYKNLGLEAEYGFRKSFYDNFDGQKDLTDPSHHALLHNNDWYTFAGISVTWKIYNKLAGCPAYSDVDEPRRKR
jgi:hypothetical protein